MAKFRVGECVRIIGKSSDHLGKTGIVGSVMSSRNSKLDRKSEELEALSAYIVEVETQITFVTGSDLERAHGERVDS